MGFKLESLHLYRKVPKDLTDATSTGGLISLVCAVLMVLPALSQRVGHSRKPAAATLPGCQAGWLARPATLPR